MAVLRGNPKGVTEPALRKTILLKTLRGQMIATKWPRKRGPAKSQAQREAINWLTWSARTFPYVAGTQMETAIIATKGTGLYPRDFITSAMAGKLYSVVLEDGTEITKLDETMELMMFNGAILQLEDDLALAAGVRATPQWPLPITDTFSFWNAGTPERLTVPTGVGFIEMFAGAIIADGNQTDLILTIRDKNDAAIAGSRTDPSGNLIDTTATGPIPVMGGDWFTVGVQTGVARTLQGIPLTFFKINVLQAVCPPA